MNAKDLVFIHGGPGLNSNPERVILTQPLIDANISYYFWDEPSRLRSDGHAFKTEMAYTNALNSIAETIRLHRPKVLVAGSFGAQLCLDFLASFKPKEDLKILFVSPVFDLYKAHRRVVSLALECFETTEPEKFLRLKKFENEIRSVWDTPMKSALALAWEAPKLPTLYFCDQSLVGQWYGSMSDEKYGIDPVSQEAVLSEFEKRSVGRPQVMNNKVTCLVGDSDPFIDQDSIQAIIETCFRSTENIIFKHSGHFPHLESRDHFVKLLQKILS